MVVHDVILASSVEESGMSGPKVVSCLGLDALEGDPHFLTRINGVQAPFSKVTY